MAPHVGKTDNEAKIEFEDGVMYKDTFIETKWTIQFTESKKVLNKEIAEEVSSRQSMRLEDGTKVDITNVADLIDKASKFEQQKNEMDQ